MGRVKLITELNNNYFSTNKITRASAQPTSGTYTVGDIVLSSSPNSSAYGWICTASGTPGSWKALRSAADLTSMSWGSITGKPSTFPPIVGTSSTTALRGDHGNTAYHHSQSAHAPSNAQRNGDITKAEIEAKLTGNVTTHSHSAYAPVSHGNHVPGKESANNARFLRNDNTWQTLKPLEINAVNAVKPPEYSTTTWTYSKVASVKLTSSGNAHAEFLISGQGNFGNVGHEVSIIRVSGRGNGNVFMNKLIDDDALEVEVGYVKTSTHIELWLARPPFDGGGVVSMLNRDGEVTIYDPMPKSTTKPSGYVAAEKKHYWSTIRRNFRLPNNDFIYGVGPDQVNHPLLGVDAGNNICLGLNNSTYINLNNTTRVYRDIHMQNGTSLNMASLSIDSGDTWSTLFLGDNHVRFEYSKNDCVYVAGSETEFGGFGTPFRAKQFDNLDPTLSIGSSSLTISSSWPNVGTGAVWFRI